MESNPQLDFARKYIEQTNINIFLTGKAGTGKTTFLKSLKDTLNKRYVVLAPTGIAALNCEGVTIHSFFQLELTPYIPGYNIPLKRYKTPKLNLIRSLELIVIDEISMVRADILDQIDILLRKLRPSQKHKAFGGVQILMIGDLSQLPPVAKASEWEILQQYYQTPYFFSSRVLQESRYLTITLEKIYRQTDAKFINILNHVRTNNITREIINQLNDRYNPKINNQNKEGCIVLCSHNHQAVNINESKLAKIDKKAFHYRAIVEGEFDEKLFPNSELLELKEGAQVMFLKNDYDATPRRYYNGTIGKIVEIGENKIVVEKDEDHERIEVSKYTWERCKYELNKNTKEISTSIIGTFTQYPIKLAWAITIHKSQGLTFEKAIIDADSSFAHGQFYVALSRCRSLEGLQLSKKFNEYSVITDVVVDNYNVEQENNKPTEDGFLQDTYLYFAYNIKDIFDFTQIMYFNDKLFKICEGDLKHLMGLDKWQEFKEFYEQILKDIVFVGQRFQSQIDKIINHSIQSLDKNLLSERAIKAADYFSQKMEIVNSMVYFLSKIEIEEDYAMESAELLLQDFLIEVELKQRLFTYISKNDIDSESFLKDFLRYKYKLIAEGEKLELKSFKNFSQAKNKKTKEKSNDLELDDLYQKLKTWRKEQAEKEGVPAFCVFTNVCLENITAKRPETLKELSSIKGVGKKVLEKYGEDILQIVQGS